MKRITRIIRPIICMAVLLFAMTTAVMGCYQKGTEPIDIPDRTPSGTSAPQPSATPAGEVIPSVDRQAELAEARAKNPDTVAWLYIPGAEVDDPVMQAEDNGYYLKLDENGEYAMWGCYYAHCENQIGGRDKLDKNTTIFGHSASNCDPDGVRFTKLYRYMDADFVKENPYIYLSVDGDDLIFQITALFITDIEFDYILICGCCGSRMTRKTNRANGKEYHYYYCPTGKKKGCAHPVMLKESSLIDCVRDSLKAYIGNIASLKALLSGIDQSSINQALAKEYSDHITDNERRLEQVLEFKARLYESLVGGMLTKEEYASYKAKYTKQAEDIRESVRVLKEKLTEVLENRSERNRWISQFTQFSTLETLDRRALIHMVQSIRVRGKKELDITFTHEDEYKKALQLLALAAQQKDYEQRKVG